MIKPVCQLLPKISSITPAMESSGCDQDSTIQIEFNKSVDEESFGNFNCLLISDSDGNDLGEYFDTPYFSSDKKTLFITPLGFEDDAKLLLKPDGSINTKNITVEVYFTGNEKDADGIKLSGSFSHRYKINKNYGKKEEVTVLVQADAALGSFLSAGETTCIVGYTIEVQFTLNKDEYLFEGLEAVSSKDESVSRADCVSYTEIESDRDRGIYKYSVRVMQETKDILIRPVCTLVPKITSITPVLESSGCDQDTSIVITFNKAMDEESFGNYECIQITDIEGNDLKEYFGTPVFSSDKKNLSIKPLGVTDNTKLILAPDGSVFFKNIIIEIDFTGSEKDTDGVALSGSTTHKYRINRDYGNKKEISVYIQSDASYGSFLSSGEKSCIVGYTIQVQFTLNKESYLFEGLEAVSSKDESVSRNDCVAFTEIESDTTRGVYKYSVRVTEEVNDILIRPVCIALPAVTSIAPSTTESLYSNAPVSVTFNMAMENLETTSQNSLFKYAKNFVSITSGSEDVSSLFNTPSLNSSKTVLTLTPDGRKLYDYIISKNAAYLDLDISLGEKITVTVQEKTLSLRQDEKSSFTVRYEAKIETTAPVKYELFAASSGTCLDENRLLTVPSEENRFTDESIASQGSFSYDEYKEKISRNRTNGTFYIYGRYYDADSGVNAVQITCQRINAKNGDEVTESAATMPLYTKDSDNARFFTDGGYTNFCIKYQIPDDKEKSDWGDGAFLFTVAVIDVVGNKSEEQTFTAIKDNYVDLSNVLFRNYQADEYAITSTYWNADNYSDVEDFLNKEIIPLTKLISLCSFKWSGYSGFFESLLTYGDIRLKTCPLDKVFIEYESNSGNTKQKMEWNDEKNIFETTLDVDSLSGLALKLCVEDEYGNSNTRDYVFPDNPEVYASYNTSSSSYGWRIKGASGQVLGIRYHQNTNKFIAERKFVSDCFGEEWSYFANIGNSNFVGDFTIITGTLPTTTSSGTFASFSSMNFEGTKCYIQLKDDVWSKYSSVICKGTVSYYYGSYNQAIPVTSSVPYGVRTTSQEKIITKDDGKEAVLYYYQNILDYYFKLQLVLYGLDSSGKLVAIKDTTYNIKTNSDDTKSPVINNVTVLKPSERVSKFGTDEFHLNDWLIVNATDFNLDSSNNVYFSELNHFDIYVSDVKKASVKASDLTKLSTNEYVVPLYGRNTNSDTYYKIIAYDNQGNASTSYSGRVNGTSENDCFNIKSVNYSNGNCSITINTTLPNSYWSLVDFFLYAYKFENGQWQLVQTFTEPKNISMQVDSDSLYKFVPDALVYMNFERWAFNEPYFLNTHTKSSGEYDLIMANGTSTSSLAVSSDEPVFIQTIVTQQAYDTCKNWTVSQWKQKFPRSLGETLIDFSPDEHGFKRYNIPVDKISSGECYVVIFHFANGTTEMSEVFVK